jgi:hypothetical protein
MDLVDESDFAERDDTKDENFSITKHSKKLVTKKPHPN